MTVFERNSDLPIRAGVTRAEVDLYVRRAHRLRAIAMRRGFRRLWTALAGRGRMAGVRPRPAH